MKAVAIISALITTTIAASLPILEARQLYNAPSNTIQEVQYRLQDLSDPTNLRWTDSVETVGVMGARWSAKNDFIGACTRCINQDGNARATRIDILTPFNDHTFCEVQMSDNHTIAVLSYRNIGADFDGVECGVSNSTNVDFYRLYCYDSEIPSTYSSFPTDLGL